eukprot:scaffold5620_cov20-Tisochrysis_lutea.AAC.3
MEEMATGNGWKQWRKGGGRWLSKARRLGVDPDVANDSQHMGGRHNKCSTMGLTIGDASGCS